MNTSSDITLNIKSVLIIIATAVAVCIGAYVFGSLGSDNGAEKYATDIARYQKEIVQPTLAKMDTLNKISQAAIDRANLAEEASKKLTSRIANLRGQATALETTAKEISNRNKFLEDSLGTLSGPIGELIGGKNKELQSKDSILGIKDSIIAEQSTQRDTDLITIANLRVGITSQTERADKAENIIRLWPKPPEPTKFLGITIPIPSRSQMFIVGIVAGGATTYLLRK